MISNENIEITDEEKKQIEQKRNKVNNILGKKPIVLKF